jgi:hypothetical protein
MSESFNPHIGWPVQQKMGDYFDMISDDGGAHLAWAGTFNNEQDVYYSYITPEETTGIPCSDVTAYQARCNASGTAQALVRIAGDYSGQTVTFDVDETPHDVILTSNGTNSFGRLTIPGIGVGPHVIELVDPAGCFPPTNINCRVQSADQSEWEALEAEYLASQFDGEAEPSGMLLGNYPNPSNPSTTIRYVLSTEGPVSLKIYNTLGEVVQTLVDGHQTAGSHEVVWDGRDATGSAVARGMYIYRLTAGGTSETGRMLLTK